MSDLFPLSNWRDMDVKLAPCADTTCVSFRYGELQDTTQRCLGCPHFKCFLLALAHGFAR